MAYPHRGLQPVGEILLFESERNIDKTDQHRHFYQGSDDRRKCLARVYAEDRHRNSNGQLKIVRSRRKAQGRGFFVGSAHLHGQIIGDKEHHDKIDAEGNGYSNHIQRELHDVFPP